MMNKVFLSHSSKDKGLYIRIVAEKLGKENIEYDEWTFEEGEKTVSEIEKKIDSSNIFALFISNDSLESGWVEAEIQRANSQLTAGKIKKIYPIIIDPNITYNDSRIPDFLRDNYNLKYISKPSVVVRRILSKLRELHWGSNPLSLARQSLFVGRNEFLNDFESRFDNIDLPKPICIIASGFQKIGRSSILKHSLVKANIINHTYQPINITLDRVDSIEDVILKLFDTGLTSLLSSDLSGMLDKSMKEKESLLLRIFIDIQNTKEIIFIEDTGCLVTHTREVSPWLLSVISNNVLAHRPVIAISAKYRINKGLIRPYKSFFTVDIPELSPSERKGLLKRLLEIQNIRVSTDDFNFFAQQLHGFPEEAYYCVDLISDYGLAGAKKEIHQLTEFNTERSSVLIRKYENDQKALDFVYFLSRFEFVSMSFIYEIVDENEYEPILNDLVTHLICDFIGMEQEFVRVNDTIRDFIQRNRLELPESYRDKLRKHVKDFIQDTDKFERDSSDFLYSVKEALARNEKIDEKYLVPSHILRTIHDLYYSRENLRRVVTLADMLLQKEATLDLKVSQDVIYYLCLSLARLKDKRVVKEVFRIRGPEHDFVLGYYYRLCGRHTEAIAKLSGLLNTPYIVSRTKRELVQVYLYIEEFDKALEMAKDNYEANRGNQFHIQSYMNCLLNSETVLEHQSVITGLIGELELINSNQSREMMYIARGLVEAKINSNMTKAYNFIDDAIAINPAVHYPYFAKFDIALKFRDTETMLDTLADIKKLAESRTFSQDTIIKYEAYCMAITGNIKGAENLISTKLDNYPPDTIAKLNTKLISTATNKNGKTQ